MRSLQTSFSPPHRIFVVDNGSCDGSVETLRESLDSVDIIETGPQSGLFRRVQRRHSAALAAAADQVLLVNSDVVLAPDAIDYLLDALDDVIRELGIAAPLLLSREEPGWMAPAGNQLLPADRPDAPARVRAARRGARRRGRGQLIASAAA